MKMAWDEKINDYMVYADTPCISVKEAKATPDYKLHLTFNTGERKVFDMRPYLNRRVFKPLEDMNFFLKAYADGMTVVWNDEVDIAPEILYEGSVPV